MEEIRDLVSAALGTGRVISSGHWLASAPGAERGKRRKKKASGGFLPPRLHGYPHKSTLLLCGLHCPPTPRFQVQREPRVGRSPSHPPGLARGLASHSFPIFGSGAVSVSREAQLGAVLREAVGRMCREMFGLALVAHCGACAWGAGTPGFACGTSAQLCCWSMGTGWGGEGSCSLPAECSELCSVVGTWKIMARRGLLWRSFRTREFAPQTLGSV